MEIGEGTTDISGEGKAQTPWKWLGLIMNIQPQVAVLDVL